jgi:hypothetical protein
LVITQTLKSFKTDFTVKVNSFEEIPKISKKLLDHYAKCYSNHNFTYRILLPRVADSQEVNNDSKKMGMYIQNELLSGIRSSKLKPNIKEFRYVHDNDSYGWILFDPSFSHHFE